MSSPNGLNQGMPAFGDSLSSRRDRRRRRLRPRSPELSTERAAPTRSREPPTVPARTSPHRSVRARGYRAESRLGGRRHDLPLRFRRIREFHRARHHRLGIADRHPRSRRHRRGPRRPGSARFHGGRPARHRVSRGARPGSGRHHVQRRRMARSQGHGQPRAVRHPQERRRSRPRHRGRHPGRHPPARPRRCRRGRLRRRARPRRHVASRRRCTAARGCGCGQGGGHLAGQPCRGCAGARGDGAVRHATSRR